ncbi:MAG TPA: hypothetical protein VM095_12595 [Pyrinomonadaceae bacterium]|nr:hypothetical protein [Pyrinomonadaceae bacterium]
MKGSTVILIGLCGLLLTACSQSGSPKKTVRTGPPVNDVEFAREVFELLQDGDMAAEDLLDWEHLNMVGVADVGPMYSKISGEDSRARFRKGFINGYSSSFKKSGGSIVSLSNWREQSRDATNTQVAADGPGGKLLLLTVTHIEGQQKISTFELK